MQSFLLVPSTGFQRPRCGCNCPAEHGPGPIRPRYQYRRRWQPRFGLTPNGPSFLSHVFRDDGDDEPSLASLVLCLKDGEQKRRGVSGQSGNKVKPSDNPNNSKPSEEDQPDEQASDKFSVSMELGDRFAPEEISVKLVGRSLRVEAKHEESEADGHFSVRLISRAFHLPDDVDIEGITSVFSEDGVLSIEAPKLPARDVGPAERTIPIRQSTEKPVIKDGGPSGAEESGKGNTATTDRDSTESSGKESETGDTKTTVEGDEETAVGKEGEESTNQGDTD